MIIKSTLSKLIYIAHFQWMLSESMDVAASARCVYVSCYTIVFSGRVLGFLNLISVSGCTMSLLNNGEWQVY